MEDRNWQRSRISGEHLWFEWEAALQFNLNLLKSETKGRKKFQVKSCGNGTSLKSEPIKKSLVGSADKEAISLFMWCFCCSFSQERAKVHRQLFTKYLKISKWLKKRKEKKKKRKEKKRKEKKRKEKKRKEKKRKEKKNNKIIWNLQGT